tara:strand:+ start:631 stop:1152 length:522 start_codon:yes stop_codon:yes gene_type:complete
MKRKAQPDKKALSKRGEKTMSKNRLVIDTRKTAREVFEKIIEPELLEKGISEELIKQIEKSSSLWDEDFIMELAQHNRIYPSWEFVNQYDFRRSSRVRIKEFLLDNHGIKFTYDEIAQKLQLIPNTVYQLLHRMIKKGDSAIMIEKGRADGMGSNKYWIPSEKYHNELEKDYE